MRSETLRALLGRLSATQPRIDSRRLAAVSVIVADEGSPKTLLIRRAEREGDPWSGQVAFPGGKVGEGDGSAKDTATREAKEEVGVDLSRAAKFAGYFVPFRTHTGDMDVIPVVFLLEGEVRVTPNVEVSGFRWVQLEEFLRPSSVSAHRITVEGSSTEMPAFAIGDYLVWGLTHRIISALLGVASP